MGKLGGRGGQLFIRGSDLLLPGPAGSAFFQERGDTFLGVLGERIHGHYFLGVSVGFGLVKIDLGVVGLLDRKSVV